MESQSKDKNEPQKMQSGTEGTIEDQSYPKPKYGTTHHPRFQIDPWNEVYISG